MVRLRNVGLSRSYRRSLVEAGTDLLRRMGKHGHFPSKTTPPQLIDGWVEQVVEEAHAEGERLYWVTLGVLGLQRGLKISGSLLRGTWRCIQGWRSLRPVRSRIPITTFVLEGLILQGIHSGWRENGWLRKQAWACALAVWLGFVGLLRPAEILQLKVGDLSFSSPGGGLGQDPGLVVVVRNPKTRRIWHKQFVLCRDDRLERWLKWWVQGMPARKSLFNFSRYVWQKHFSALIERLGLEACRFTLGSLRAGGATSHFRKHGNLGELQFLGRWTSQSTLRFYLQEAFSMHVESQISTASMQLLNTLHRFDSLLECPPQQPLRVLIGEIAHAGQGC